MLLLGNAAIYKPITFVNFAELLYRAFCKFIKVNLCFFFVENRITTPDFFHLSITTDLELLHPFFVYLINGFVQQL